VTIDCPAECPYLVASRHYDLERREFDSSKLPFADRRVPTSFVQAHEPLLMALGLAICRYAREHAPLVDTHVAASLASLAETYRTLSSGIYYDKPPDYVLERGLYEALKAAIQDHKEAEARASGISNTRDGEIRDALIFLAQLGAMESNGRPKGRAYIDFLRGHFAPEESPRPASNIVLL